MKNGLTRRFVLQAPDLIEGRELRTRIKMIIPVVVIGEPRPAQFASIQTGQRDKISTDFKSTRVASKGRTPRE
jgi:hypothetical protein